MTERFRLGVYTVEAVWYVDRWRIAKKLNGKVIAWWGMGYATQAEAEQAIRDIMETLP